MNVATIARSLCISVGCALTACGGGLSPVAEALRATPQAATPQRLLYISDLQSFDVYVYAFPSLHFTRKLSGFNDPEGLCTDAGGNVWIADTTNERMVEYAHGGSTPIATLSDPTGYPVGCAVERKSSDLAVTNFYDFSGAGSVLVYRSGRGTPRVYDNAKQFYYYFAGYDPDGDLYVSGATSQNAYVLSVLPRGKSAMSNVTIRGGSLHVAGTVAWHQSTLILGDQRCKDRRTSCLYQLRVSGRNARIIRTIPLSGSCDVVQAWVGPSQIAGGDDAAYCHGHRSSVDIWRYPHGGTPRNKTGGPGIPVGAAVSTANGI